MILRWTLTELCARSNSLDWTAELACSVLALAMSYCDCSGGRRDSVLVVHSIALDLPRCVMW